MTYQEKLQDPRWQKKRLQVLNRDNFTCIYCGDEKTTLHIHHLSYNKNPWDSELDQLKTACKFCHKAIETAKVDDPDVVIYSIKRLEGNNPSILRMVCYGEDEEKTPTLIVYGTYVEVMNYERIVSITENSLESLFDFLKQEKKRFNG